MVRLSTESNPAAAARDWAEKTFNRGNGDPAGTKAELDRASSQLKHVMDELTRANLRLENTPEKRTFPTREVTKPLSRTRLVESAIGCFMILADTPLTLYTAGSYLSSSGRLETLANDTFAATMFCFVFVAGVYGLKAIGDLRPTDREKVRYTTFLLSIGALALLLFAIGFAICFNPAGLSGPSGADALGTLSPPLDWRLAAGLVFTQLVATVCLGAGIGLYVSRALDENKVHHAIKNPEHATATKAVADLKARCLELEATVAGHTDYLAKHAHDRDAFIASVEGKVLGIASYVRAKTTVARHEVQSQLAGSLDALKAALKEPA
jgi:hypothetical protein